MDYKQLLEEKFPGRQLECAMDQRGILTVSGECESWEQLIDIGHAAAKLGGVKNVVSEMTVRGLDIPKKDYSAFKSGGEVIGVVDSVDVLVIGAGISGCGIARELAKYDLRILVIDKAEDVATGATKANNGNIHPGHDVTAGTLKAKLNIEGNRMYTKWAEELGFELQRCGAMGAVADKRFLPIVDIVCKKAVENGVDGAVMVDGERAYELEPGLARNGDEGIEGALWLPSMGLVEPYKVAVALAENAADNGVRFWFNCTAADILHSDGAVQGAVTSKGIVHAKYVVNCAGVYADEISAMAGDKSYTIHPRKGVIAILDKSRVPLYDSLLDVIDMNYVMAKKGNSKGGGMCRTPEWNILMGPSAKEIPDNEDLSVTEEELAFALGRGKRCGIGYGDVIRPFAGIRPADFKEDFVIEMSPVTDGFINVGAIQSPGLAAAPAIAEMVENILSEHASNRGAPLTPRANHNPIREREIEFRHLSEEEQRELVEKDPSFGRIVCRCETVTEGEIRAALRSPVLPTSIDAIKRRTRAGMGRCQGGFCQCHVMDILARELCLDKMEICLAGEGSHILLSRTK